MDKLVTSTALNHTARDKWVILEEMRQILISNAAPVVQVSDKYGHPISSRDFASGIKDADTRDEINRRIQERFHQDGMIYKSGMDHK